MDPKRGIFIAIESADSSTKAAQFELLKQRLENGNYPVVVFDFPRHTEPSSYFVRQYLRGAYGERDKVSPYTTSLFYALDRYDATASIRAALDAGNVVLTDRFTGSNMAHQGIKLRHVEERRGFFIWLDNLEYQTLGIPRPDLNLVLHTSSNLPSPQQQAATVYEDMCQLFPKDFTRIDSIRSGKPMNADDIHKVLWEKITPLLPLPRTHASLAKIESPTNAAATADNTASSAQHAKQNIPQHDLATNNQGSIYAFTDKLSPLTSAAAFARFSQSSEPMRAIVKDLTEEKSQEEVLSPVANSRSNNSLKQLVHQHIVVEKASNLLIKKLEHGRLSTYVERAARYNDYDQKDENGHYRFYVPEHFDADTKSLYIRTQREIFSLYANLVRGLIDHLQHTATTPPAERGGVWQKNIQAKARDIASATLPVAAQTTVGIYTSARSLEHLLLHLLSDELPEAHYTGEVVLQEIRKTTPSLFAHTDRLINNAAYKAEIKSSVRELVQTYLPSNHAAGAESVTLTNIWPRNELDLIPDMLYETSDQSLETIKREVDTWSYGKKAEAFQSYMGNRQNPEQRPGRALEKAHYSWDILCDYNTSRDLQRHRMVDSLEWQALTPRYGYEMPHLIEEANLTDIFERCFDLSLGLYSHLQGAGYTVEAQYATLFGHRLRWKVTYNAREAFHIHELHNKPETHPNTKKLVQQLHQKLSEIHPLLTEQMKFVDSSKEQP